MYRLDPPPRYVPAFPTEGMNENTSKSWMTLIPSYPNSRMHQAYVSYFFGFLGGFIFIRVSDQHY